MTRATLFTEIKDIAARDDIDTALANYTKQVEAEFLTMGDLAEPMLSDRMLTETTLTLVADKASLPTDWVETHLVYTADTPALKYRANYLKLEKDEYSILTRKLHSPNEDTANGSDFDVKFVYYKKVTALANDDDTNWVLDNHYPVYVNGLLSFIYQYEGDEERHAKYRNLFMSAMQAVHETSRNREWSGGTLEYKAG